MLKSLEIKDYALIENIHVEFEKGLNIITGETGAGKSILIGAMGLLLGERASTEVIRKGSKKSIIEGIFDVTGNLKITNFLEQNDIDSSNELIVRREISLKGSNRCFLNDTPTSLSNIKEIGDLLVDLHGQHEHQSLLKQETHIELIDEFIKDKSIIKNFQEERVKLLEKIKEYQELLKREHSIAEKKQLWEFQLKEIESVNPQNGEEENLEAELMILENAEKLLESTTGIFEALYESDNSIYDAFVKIERELEELNNIDKSFEEKVKESRSALAIIKDISDFIRSYKDDIDLNPERLEEVRERLSSFNMLKKKYGGSIENVINHYKKIKEEFELAENFSERIANIENEIDRQRDLCGKKALILSEERKKISAEIKKEIAKALSYLGISDSTFEVNFTKNSPSSNDLEYICIEEGNYKLTHNGIDEVEFLISTNIGEDPKPLVKVASGGEISRIMLALKTILAKSDNLPLLIFDEIDTGVSGRIAQKVGHTLKDLASHHQIIAITHLPQIAGLSDAHYSVEKIKLNNRVVSTIRKLSYEEKVNEIAKLLGGENITEANLKGAKELMG